MNGRWSSLAPGYSHVASWESPPSAGFRGKFWAGPWDVFQPPYLHATEEVGPRDGITIYR